jgi:hypothetical protein
VIVSNSFRTFEREISLFIEFALKSNLDDWLFQWRGGYPMLFHGGSARLSSMQPRGQRCNVSS